MKKNKILKQFIKNFKKEILKHENIIIFHHINPDGDCLGSQLGLKLWLQQKYPSKNIYAIGDNKNIFNFIKWEFDNDPLELENYDKTLGIVVDANYLNRINDYKLINDNKIKTLIRIDHHPEDDDLDYKFRWVDDEYCSTSEQITDLILQFDKNIYDIKIAEVLYLGIYTDSGRFFFDKTSSRTHFLTSKLFETGFDFDSLHKKLGKRTIQELEYQKHVLNNYKIDGNVIYYFISLEEAKKLKLEDNLKNRVDFLANIEGIDVWIFFIENDDGTIRTRFRSNSKNVNKLAKEYGGGGHIRASGAIIENKFLISEIIKKAKEIN